MAPASAMVPGLFSTPRKITNHHDDDDHRPRRLQGARSVLSRHRDGPRGHCGWWALLRPAGGRRHLRLHHHDSRLPKTRRNYAAILGRLEMLSYQRFSEPCSSGTKKLIALAAKSTVTRAVISAMEKRSPATNGTSPNRASKSAKKFFTRSLLRSASSGICS